MAQIFTKMYFKRLTRHAYAFVFAFVEIKTEPEDALTLLAVNKGTYHGTTPIKSPFQTLKVGQN